MSGYTELLDLGVRFVPPDGPMPVPAHRWPNFRAPWSQTVKLLARELASLDAKGISVELDMESRMFRLDGLPRSDAQARSDGVRISFTSKWGPLRYETAEFTNRWGVPGWQLNMRAIALSMEALRAVDRYGVSKRGEQYRGWKQLGTGSNPADTIVTHAQAEAFLAQWPTVKDAIRATHPDTGGAPDDFLKVQKARELLGV